MMRWAGHVARIEEMRNLYSISVDKTELRRRRRRTRSRREYNIRRDLREIGWKGVNEMRLARDTNQWRALIDTVINLQVP
jgi:hypothetical protein